MRSYPKRLIEVDLPIKRISKNARTEKDSRLGHIPRVHIYPAARPVAACRAIVCASIWLDPADNNCPVSFREAARVHMSRWATDHLSLVGKESFKRFVRLQKNDSLLEDHFELRDALLDFIADFSDWNNASLPEYLQTSQELTRAAHSGLGSAPGTRPLVIDPFGGGGAIPLEALRIGANAFSSDLNAVANLIQNVVLKYIPTYGEKLANSVAGWLQWLQARERSLLGKFYPEDDDGSIPVAYLWARTVLSENPDGEQYPVEIPMLRSMWLARQKNRKRALRWVRGKTGHVKTEVVTVRYESGVSCKVRRPLLEIFTPTTASEVERGVCAGNAATCPVTGFTMPAKSVKKQLRGRNGGGEGRSVILCCYRQV